MPEGSTRASSGWGDRREQSPRRALGRLNVPESRERDRSREIPKRTVLSNKRSLSSTAPPERQKGRHPRVAGAFSGETCRRVGTRSSRGEREGYGSPWDT